MIALCALAKLLPTHKTDIRYPSPKSSSSGRGLTFGLKASNIGCFAHAKLEYSIFQARNLLHIGRKYVIVFYREIYGLVY